MKLQYITQEIPGKTHWQLAKEACMAGVNWIQLRVKSKPLGEWHEIALKTKEITDQYASKLIVNDSLEVALAVKADGVHLGKQDTTVREARKTCPQGFIVGGTANTFEDIVRLVEEGADYVGLGPYRFTRTKENLSPVLGLEGYRAILQRCCNEGIEIPIVAIGGIVPKDVTALMEIGIKGIAVSSVITRAEDKKKMVGEFMSQMSEGRGQRTDVRDQI